MRYYYGVEQADGTVKSASHIKKGTTKTQYKKLGRILFYTEITISGYLWNVTKLKWVKKEEVNDISWYFDFKGDSPKSAKAFNRYVQKLLKEYDFEKGTVIQLSGRFNGIGIFCIVGGKNGKV